MSTGIRRKLDSQVPDTTGSGMDENALPSIEFARLIEGMEGSLACHRKARSAGM
jgi:hypothetical protein